ncbi:MAG: peptide deformylase [Oscillospiraceae bacterium]|nr:peptide deformylase [Oscillospiraceae bacterium]
MAIRKILTGDEPALHKVCHPVTKFDEKLAILLDDMRETLAEANGLGLAAPQVGILRRAVLVVDMPETPENGGDTPEQDAAPEEKSDPEEKAGPAAEAEGTEKAGTEPEGEEGPEKENPQDEENNQEPEAEVLELINPEIFYTEGESEELEGCLSIPGKWGYVKRPTLVRARAQDRNGDEFEIEATGYTARCVVHECEHLDGHLFSELCDRLYTADDLQELAEQAKKEEEQEGSDSSEDQEAAGMEEHREEGAEQ